MALKFPADWRERAHSFKGTFKQQAVWSDGFNAARNQADKIIPELLKMAEAHVARLKRDFEETGEGYLDWQDANDQLNRIKKAMQE